MNSQLEFRMSLKKLLIGFGIAVVPISLAGLYSIWQSDHSMENAVGNQFQMIAESTSQAIARDIHNHVKDVAVLAVMPVLVDAVSEANRSYATLSQDAIDKRIMAIEDGWNTPAADPFVNRMLSSPASRMLQRFREIDPSFLRITVTDAYGAVVAASHKTIDYYQADEDYWQAISAGGRGAISLTDILNDPLTHANYIGVGAPILEPVTNRFIGTIDALVDVSSLFPLINQPQIGSTGRVELVKGDGKVINAPDVTLAMKRSSADLAALWDAHANLQFFPAGHGVSAVAGSGRRLIAFADTGLMRDYQNLNWLVVVSQDAREALAPVRWANRLLAFMALVGLLAVMVLALFFSIHRRDEYVDIADGSGEEPAVKETSVGEAGFRRRP